MVSALFEFEWIKTRTVIDFRADMYTLELLGLISADLIRLRENPVGLLRPLLAQVSLLVVSSVIPSGWCPVPIYVHRDWGIVHPTGSVRRVILWCVLSLGAVVVPLRAWLLGSEGSKISIS